jgi:hypothetical protein
MNADLRMSTTGEGVGSAASQAARTFGGWEMLICVLGLLNLVVFARSVLWIVLGQRGPAALRMDLLWLGVVACAVAIARLKGRGPDPRAARLRLLLLAGFAAPLGFLFLWHLLLFVLSVPLSVLQSVAHWLRPPEIVMIYLMGPALGAYYTLPTLRAFVYVATTTGFLVFILREHTWRFYPWKTMGLSVITCLFAWRVLWWHLTGQKLVFL